MSADMGKLTSIWLLILLTIFVLTVCFSIIRITYATADLFETSERALEEISASFAEMASERDADLTGLLKEGGLGEIFRFLDEMDNMEY